MTAFSHILHKHQESAAAASILEATFNGARRDALEDRSNINHVRHEGK